MKQQTLLAARALTAALSSAVLLSAVAARAEPVEEFYRGKTIELLIGAAAAGGYDVAGRLLANHLARHIPGNPGIVVRNMPGATGLIMTNYLYGVARRDGTVIGMPTSNIPLEPRLKLVSPTAATSSSISAASAGSARRCRSRKSPGSGIRRRPKASRISR
jgi:tripartite-type tricarboxylate transporter receptor subunit TctC